MVMDEGKRELTTFTPNRWVWDGEKKREYQLESEAIEGDKENKQDAFVIEGRRGRKKGNKKHQPATKHEKATTRATLGKSRQHGANSVVPVQHFIHSSSVGQILGQAGVRGKNAEEWTAEK